MNAEIRNTLYDQHLVVQSPVSASETAHADDSRDLLRDIHHTIDVQAKKTTTRAEQQVDDSFTKAVTEANLKKEELPNAYIDAMSGHPIDRRRCNFFIRWACDSLNKAYQDGINRQGQRMRMELSKVSNAATLADLNFRQTIKKSAAEEIAQFATEAKRIVTRAASILSVMQALAILLLAISIIKSWTYLFARIALSDLPSGFPEGNKQSFDPHNKRQKTGEFSLSDLRNEVELDMAPGQAFYVATNLNFVGHVEQKSIPHPFTQVLSRILNRKYVFHKIVGVKNNTKDVDIRGNVSNQFVQVELAVNEEMFFRTNYLAGFSDTITFKSYVTWRLLGYAFGRFSYRCAVGPGTLLLVVPGGCSIPDAKDECFQHLIVAWFGRARFSVKSSLRIWDLYFSGVSVSSTFEHSCVIENAANVRQRHYVLRFLRRFFVPL